VAAPVSGPKHYFSKSSQWPNWRFPLRQLPRAALLGFSESSVFINKVFASPRGGDWSWKRRAARKNLIELNRVGLWGFNEEGN
jgi:hypothetical protein